MQTQTIQLKVDKDYLQIVLSLLQNLQNLKHDIIKDLSLVNGNFSNLEIIPIEKSEIESFSNHTANLIEGDERGRVINAK
ncbi:hypothetical protein MNB_SV-14-1641 [hydrothermal vent metagenome]|uniref:Uncharacterized protein n=1 Tax=hydrothermal vent metagenome TaxID=652676 RepID=A0A1W1CTI9_9ZZZZ